MSDSIVLDVVNYSKHFLLHEQEKLIPSSQGVNLSVNKGELTALIGPTGSGKSSVLKGIYRTYLPTSGNLYYRTRENDFVDLVSASDHQVLALRKNEIGFVTQFLHAAPRQSTESLVARPLIQRGIKPCKAKECAQDMLSQLNLPERLWSLSPSTFSGGEKQRVNLARGILAEPRLLLLDEPTSSLDATTAKQVADLIDSLKVKGCAILAIFHDLAMVEMLADKVVELSPLHRGEH